MKMKKILFLLTLGLLLLSGEKAGAQVKAKYRGEVEFGYSVGVGDFGSAASRVNFHTVQGVQLGEYFSAGLGLGLDLYHDLENELMLPIYLNMKGYIPVNETVSPYLSLDIGAGVGVTEGVSSLSGLYLTPAVGVKVRKFKFQFGYSIQQLSEDGASLNLNAIQFKVGFVF